MAVKVSRFEGHLAYMSNIEQHKKTVPVSQFGEVLKKAQSFPAILSVNVFFKMAAKVIQCEGQLIHMPNIDKHN